VLEVAVVTQPSLLELPAVRQKVRKRVRAVSVAQYADGRERFTGRKADVLRWLAARYNLVQQWPTSAELAFHYRHELGTKVALDATASLLFVRRGISDLQTAGIVEANGARVCQVSGRTVETWRVVEVGR
jgi:hypothetical protein